MMVMAIMAIILLLLMVNRISTKRDQTNGETVTRIIIIMLQKK